MPTVRPVDASMDLLKQIMEQPIDPDYAVVAARGELSSPRRWMLLITLVVAGALLASAFAHQLRSAPVRADEREQLTARIADAQTRQDQLRERNRAEAEQIRKAREANLGTSQADLQLRQRLGQLEVAAGAVAVTGPGVVIIVDDGPGTEVNDQVIDTDLQQLVNGLWSAGAEAIAINGNRITTLTSIRGAGQAITVNYRSLTRPYRVEAIGDPQTLPARYLDSSGGAWWAGLKRNYGLRHDIAAGTNLQLPSDGGLILRHVRKVDR